MYNERHGKHQQPLPKLRNIRRACNKELYRTRKRLHGHIAPDKVKAAEEYYFKKVTENLLFIVENGSNRKKLADWWCEHVCPQVAELWDVSPPKLERAFRAAFGSTPSRQ